MEQGAAENCKMEQGNDQGATGKIKRKQGSKRNEKVKSLKKEQEAKNRREPEASGITLKGASDIDAVILYTVKEICSQ